jgi:quinol monooxygenase YgiN
MQPCTIIGMVVARDDTGEELRRILTGQVAPTRAEPGCINYDFRVSEDDPNVFMFYENWRGKADLEAHLKAPHLQPLFGHLDELLARPVEMKFYEMLSQRIV